MMKRTSHALPIALIACALFGVPAQAAETVTLIGVGSSSANGWPSYVAVEKGFFAAANITPDVVYAQSNAAVIQQVAAGSAHVSTNSGLVDPIRAIEKGAPLALIRLEVQVPPYPESAAAGKGGKPRRAKKKDADGS